MTIPTEAGWLGRQITTAREEIARWPWELICNTTNLNPNIPCKHCDGHGLVLKYRSKKAWLKDWRKEIE